MLICKHKPGQAFLIHKESDGHLFALHLERIGPLQDKHCRSERILCQKEWREELCLFIRGRYDLHQGQGSETLKSTLIHKSEELSCH